LDELSAVGRRAGKRGKIRRTVLLTAGIALLYGVLFYGKLYAERQRPLLFQGDFETGDFSQFGTEGLPEELKVVTSPRRSGKYALEARCLMSDVGVGGPNWRAVVKHMGAGGDPGLHNCVRWFAFSTYVPQEWVIGDKVNLFQIHERPDFLCEDWISPPLCLRVIGNRFDWHVRSDSRLCTPADVPETKHTLYNAPLVKGRWVDWVVKVRWDYRTLEKGGQGTVTLWQDGVKRADYRGPNCYHDLREMYLKVGSYVAGWPKGVAARTAYFDEVRIGSGNATYQDVAPPPVKAR
jgi:hypothetical protein